MQIINNIEIVCSICCKNIPVEVNVGREYETNRFIYRVAPCVSCNTGLKQQFKALYGAVQKTIDEDTLDTFAELMGVMSNLKSAKMWEGG